MFTFIQRNPTRYDYKKIHIYFMQVATVLLESMSSSLSGGTNILYVTDAVSAKCWLHRCALIINPMDSFSEAKAGQRDYKSIERNDAAVAIIITEAPQCIFPDSSEFDVWR